MNSLSRRLIDHRAPVPVTYRLREPGSRSDASREVIDWRDRQISVVIAGKLLRLFQDSMTAFRTSRDVGVGDGESVKLTGNGLGCYGHNVRAAPRKVFLKARCVCGPKAVESRDAAIMTAIRRDRCITARKPRVAGRAEHSATKTSAGREKEFLIPIRWEREPHLEFVLRPDIAGHLTVLLKLCGYALAAASGETASRHVHDTSRDDPCRCVRQTLQIEIRECRAT